MHVKQDIILDTDNRFCSFPQLASGNPSVLALLLGVLIVMITGHVYNKILSKRPLKI